MPEEASGRNKRVPGLGTKSSWTVVSGWVRFSRNGSSNGYKFEVGGLDDVVGSAVVSGILSMGCPVIIRPLKPSGIVLDWDWRDPVGPWAIGGRGGRLEMKLSNQASLG